MKKRQKKKLTFNPNIFGFFYEKLLIFPALKINIEDLNMLYTNKF